MQAVPQGTVVYVPTIMTLMQGNGCAWISRLKSSAGMCDLMGRTYTTVPRGIGGHRRLSRKGQGRIEMHSCMFIIGTYLVLYLYPISDKKAAATAIGTYRPIDPGTCAVGCTAPDIPWVVSAGGVAPCNAAEIFFGTCTGNLDFVRIPPCSAVRPCIFG